MRSAGVLLGLLVGGGLLLVATGAPAAAPVPPVPPVPRTPDATEARAQLVEAARAQLGTPYQWGGGRAPATDYGVDCSGLVIASARKAGLPLPRCKLATSDGWWRCLEKVEVPLPGDLSLYGTPTRAVHVELVTGYDPATKLAQTIGANGGDSTTTTPERAKEKGAFVKESTSESKRFLGFCRYPLEKLLTDKKPSFALDAPNILMLQGDEA